jgi:rhodanese-related sulfurtransferase
MEELINKVDTFLVDVRTAAEVAEVAVPGAINIPSILCQTTSIALKMLMGW